MKKTILLALLAGSMLASCATEAKVDVNNAKVDPLAGIIEDTDAHEEIFGKAPSFGPKKAMIDGDATIKLGIQHYEADGKMAIRFIAAIDTDGAASLGDVKATWHRHIYNTSGTEVKDTVTTYEAKTAYTTLNDASSTGLAIASVGADYDYFVVYSVSNIPVTGGSDASGYYFNVYLNLDLDGDGGDPAVTSKVLATTVDQKTQFTYEEEKFEQGFFGVLKTGSTFETYNHVANPGDSNNAEIENVPFEDGDDFVIVSSAPNFFDVYGYDKMDAGVGHGAFEKEGDSQFCSCLLDAASFNFYVSKDNNKIYLGVASTTITTKFYLSTADCGDWRVGNERFALYAKDASDKDYWCNLTSVATNVYATPTITIKPGMMIFCRMNGGTVENSWSNKWNQTVDLSYNFCNGLWVSAEKEGENYKGNWGIYA